jgi:alkylation response protein AidB-like acyl-CoA dehydrogenase
MDFATPADTERFARKLDDVLGSPRTRELIEEVRRRSDGMDGDVRPLYRRLGEAGVLAPSWPAAFGGRDADFTATLVLLEKMIEHGIPQSLYYISVQIVGSLILEAGTDAQRHALLPRLASGELAACILFTEPDHGSDLASVTTRAVRDGDGWIIDGRKTFNLKSGYADLAMCAVRTGDGESRYEDLTLFLVPLDAPGVAVRPLPSLADEQFHDIRFDEVRVGADAVFGEPGAGWSLITRMFAAERNGLDYYVRARHWLNLAASRLLAGAPGEADLVGLARMRARLDASRMLTCRSLQNLQEGDADIAQASLAKWHCSETSQAVSYWSLESLGLPLLGPEGDPVLEAAFREAPGMTISGGASEVLLDIVTGARLLEDVRTGG